MSPNRLSVQITKDGCTTLFDQTLDETYHSRLGAWQESIHVFMDAGLDYLSEKKTNNITIFEVGFGTGLNVWQTYLWSQKRQINTDIISVETQPIPPHLLADLNYKSFEKNTSNHSIFDDIHASDWNKTHTIGNFFTYQKWKCDFLKTDFSNYYNQIDCCFFDAFAPNKQEEMWTISALSPIFKMLKQSGILVTYSSQGQFRRNLKALGFAAERIPGPNGKLHMTRAHKL